MHSADATLPLALPKPFATGALGLLGNVIDAKLAYAGRGGAGSWFQLVASGMLANWLVGMAAFFAMMGRTILGKYVPVLLAVTAFVAAGLQHAPTHFALWMAETGQGPGWATALGWNIIPAGIGNMIDATLFVALPFWHVYRPSAT